MDSSEPVGSPSVHEADSMVEWVALDFLAAKSMTEADQALLDVKAVVPISKFLSYTPLPP